MPLGGHLVEVGHNGPVHCCLGLLLQVRGHGCLEEQHEPHIQLEIAESIRLSKHQSAQVLDQSFEVLDLLAVLVGLVPVPVALPPFVLTLTPSLVGRGIGICPVLAAAVVGALPCLASIPFFAGRRVGLLRGEVSLACSLGVLGLGLLQGFALLILACFR